MGPDSVPSWLRNLGHDVLSDINGSSLQGCLWSSNFSDCLHLLPALVAALAPFLSDGEADPLGGGDEEPSLPMPAAEARTGAEERSDAPATDSSGARGPLRLVIGRVADLQAPGAIGSDEYTLLGKLTPRIGSAQGDWLRNAGALRAELKSGITEIRDASPGDTGGQYLNAERNLLENNGWTFDPITSIWYAP
jgi:hypothetical protein